MRCAQGEDGEYDCTEEWIRCEDIHQAAIQPARLHMGEVKEKDRPMVSLPEDPAIQVLTL